MTAYTASAPPLSGTEHPPPGWVPVDQRFAGFDRRTAVPALLLVVVTLLLHFAIPAVDDATAFNDPVRPGEVMALSGDVTITPIEGWNVESGLRTGQSANPPPGARLVHGDIGLTVGTGTFSGDSRALLDQIMKSQSSLGGSAERKAVSAPVQITSARGEHGMMVRFRGASSEDVLVAFARNGTGVKIMVRGPSGTSGVESEDITSMIKSLNFEGKAAR